MLMLPTTIAGFVLLLLGNGTPNVFSSTVVFVGINVGFNRLLGGAVLL